MSQPDKISNHSTTHKIENILLFSSKKCPFRQKREHESCQDFSLGRDLSPAKAENIFSLSGHESSALTYYLCHNI